MLSWISFLLAAGLVAGQAQGNFPQYYRLEVEMTSFENPNSVDAKNSWCDTTSKCDTSVAALIDTDTPRTPFVSVKDEKTVYTVDNNDSPNINIAVTKDICGGATNEINFRAYVYDSDPGVTWVIIDEFDCPFTFRPEDVAGDAKSAKYNQMTDCKAKHRPQDHRLFVRARAYKTDEASCQVDKAQVMQILSQSTKSRTAHTPGKHDNIKLEVELIKLDNPNGKTYKGEHCDSTGPCDPFFSVKLSTDRPFWKWPGPDGENGFKQVDNFWDKNSVQLNRKMNRKICGGELDWVNLRVKVQDGDPVAIFSDYTTIENYECIFQFDYSLTDEAESSADWGPSQNCNPQHPGHEITLQYRVRSYDIDAKDCGVA